MKLGPVSPARGPVFWPGSSLARPGNWRAQASMAPRSRSCLGHNQACGLARHDPVKEGRPITKLFL